MSLREWMKLYEEMITPYRLSAPTDEPIIEQWSITVSARNGGEMIE